ncbi:MAG TPA: PaaI family thioesterase [Pseudomonadales bacterium]|nr:PaaI family thioesterase [Pseudomonadales bacterium]
MVEDPLRNMPPHGQAIGMELVGYEGHKVTVKVPYGEHLVGDPDTGVIHGGVITATLDNASGWAIRARTDKPEGVSMATLDIRIDYMRPAEPYQDLLVESECFKFTRNVAFVRALAHQGDPEDPIATSIAAFMLGTPSGPRE